MLILGKKLQEEILNKLRVDVRRLGFTPVVYDIVASLDPVQEKFVEIKQKAASSIGIEFKVKRADGEVSEEEFAAVIKNISEEPGVVGIIVQLPLPNHLDRGKILAMIPPELDVDCLNPLNIWWESGRFKYTPPVAAAIEYILSGAEKDKSKQIITSP
jgi:methylenetetrahydrofolate dehydrogenase (NADP+)/methenyltetrahydrofolate cyclohydrolase